MRQKGFSLIELLVVVAVFTIVTGAVFGLLNVAQRRYKMESEFLDSFQGARLAIDQMMRDIHTAGYPPRNTLPAAVAAANPQLVADPFAWDPGYPAVTCTVGAGCNTPGDFDLIVETDVDPEDANGVEWVRYTLQRDTLFRGVVPKTPGTNPVTATQAALVPYVENVVNAADATMMNAIRASYPAMFPGGGQVPIFRYAFDAGPGGNVPRRIREINVTLIVVSPTPDPQTRQLRVMTLTALARRFNP